MKNSKNTTDEEDIKIKDWHDQFHQLKTELKDNTAATFMWTPKLKVPEGSKE